MARKVIVLSLVIVVLGLGSLLVLSGNQDYPQYSRHVWPGSIQVFEDEDRFFVFMEFKQVFTPLDKQSGWDHPKGRQRGSYQWLAEIPKSEIKGKYSRINSLEIDDVSYGVTFHPNLSEIFWHENSWYLWSGESFEVESSVLRLNEAEMKFELVEIADSIFVSELLGLKGDAQKFRFLHEYKSDSAKKGVFEDAMISSEPLAPLLKATVDRAKEVYTVRYFFLADDRPFQSVELVVPEGFRNISGTEIDALPIRNMGKLKPWYKRLF